MSQMFTLTPEQVRELDDIRKERRVRIKDAFAANRQRMIRIKKVRQTLAASAEPMTVPELVVATGLAAPDVLWCVMAMKKYGVIGERSSDDGYFRYGLEEAAADVPEDDD
jgi:hypothetical protein